VKNVLRAVAGVLMVGLLSPSLGYADPVTITSGVLTWRSGFGNFSGSLSGIDARGRSFFFEGGGSTGGGPGWCYSCEGGPVLFVTFAAGGFGSLVGQVTYGGQLPYRVGNIEPPDSRGDMLIQEIGSRSFDMLKLQPGTIATLIVPFQDGGSRFIPPEGGGPPGGWLPGGRLFGSGLAYVNIEVNTTGTGGEPFSAEYRFGESALTPEPATALLFATGALVLASRRRHSQS
jgi:hypothetical protein